MGTCEGRFVSHGAKLRVSGCLLPRELRWISKWIWSVKAQWPGKVLVKVFRAEFWAWMWTKNSDFTFIFMLKAWYQSFLLKKTVEYIHINMHPISLAKKPFKINWIFMFIKASFSFQFDLIITLLYWNRAIYSFFWIMLFSSEKHSYQNNKSYLTLQCAFWIFPVNKSDLKHFNLMKFPISLNHIFIILTKFILHQVKLYYHQRPEPCFIIYVTGSSLHAGVSRQGLHVIKIKTDKTITADAEWVWKTWECWHPVQYVGR